MIIKLYKCQMCGHRFEVELLDRSNPKEKDQIGHPVCCDECHSPRVEPIRVLRKAS